MTMAKELDYYDVLDVAFWFLFIWGVLYTPSVSFYLSLDSTILHYPATNKKKQREYLRVLYCC
jgi:hypothetical protein